MKTRSKNSVITITSSFLLMSLISVSVLGSTTTTDKKKTAVATARVNIEVVDAYGMVKYSDHVTKTDKHIDFDLYNLPVGNYTVKVKLGERVINTVSLKNITNNQKVITVEVLNNKGEQVFESNDPKVSFDLSKMPKGKYTVNVYKGSELINTNKLMNS